MTKELIINSTDEGVEIALLENKKLVELHYEKGANAFVVGDVYLGKIKKLMPGLNAAFVDVGYEKDAFLHYTDLSPYIKSLVKFTKLSQEGNIPPVTDFGKFQNEPNIPKTGKVTEVFITKPDVLVQVLKEPISSKGPRLSCEISLPGRFLVLTPFNDAVNISRKILANDERKRLQKIVESIKPKNFGVIVRTAAEGKNTAELHTDITELLNTWQNIQTNLKDAKSPKKILGEQDKTTSILRDLLNDSFEKIVVNNKDLAAETKEYVSRIMPEQQEIVTLYNNPQPIFDTYGITKQLKQSFGKTVNLDSGAYLIIEHTEALHVIDVNSGTRSAEAGQEQNALITNLEAAQEITRQMRLRDLGGIIIIDFIDMKLAENKKQLSDAMGDFMASDRARHTILPLTRFGLMQITRQRLRPEINIVTAEVCPTCKGTGLIAPTMLLGDEIEKDVRYLKSQGHKELAIHVNPIVDAFLTKGTFLKPSFAKKLSKSYGVKLNVVSDISAPITQYLFFDPKTEDHIKL